MADTPEPAVSVLFVCLGNICRSPLAEAVMRHRVRERGLEAKVRVESAGTGGWHVGEPPDPRSAEVARRNGIAMEGRGQQLSPADAHRFDWIVAMDRENLRAIEALRDREGGGARVCLLREFDPDPGDREVPDPYYGGPGGFDDVYDMVSRSVDAFLDHLEAEAW